MPHLVIKITRNEDRDEIPAEEQKWCLSVDFGGGNTTLCSGEFYEEGESHCAHKSKVVNKGGITCNECLSKIKTIQDVKL